jgi:hypothetical protein
VPVTSLSSADQLSAYQRPEEVGCCREVEHGDRLPATTASFSLEDRRSSGWYARFAWSRRVRW